MVNVLKFQTLISIFSGLNFAFYAVVFKIHSGMANNVDPVSFSPCPTEPGYTLPLQTV